MKNSPGSLLSLGIEALEDRHMLAGNVTANVVGTVLQIEADAARNDYVISSSGGDLQLTSGADATGIALTGDLASVRRVEINDIGGDDLVTIQDVNSLSSVRINSSSGEKYVVVERTGLRKLDIVLNDGIRLDVEITDSQVARTTRIGVNQASLRMELAGTSTVGRRVITEVTGGDDNFRMSDMSRVSGGIRRITTGGGNSSTELVDQVDVRGLVQVRNLEGRSDVRILDEATIGRFRGSGFTRELDITYADRDGTALGADIYVPNSAGLHPAVVALHGGAWRFGNKGGMSGEAARLAERGYVVMSINYRLAPQDRFPAQIHDVKAAISWLKANAAEYSVDASRIGLWGYSAGGHLALLAGLTTAADGLEDPDAPAGSPATTVQAVVAAAPPTDFRNVDPNSDRYVHLFGGTRAELPDLYTQASPAHWVSASDPPVFMYIGENDRLVSGSDAEQLHDDLESAGVDSEFQMVPRKNHLSARRDRAATLGSLRFLDQQLKT